MKSRTIMQQLIQKNMEGFWKSASKTNHLFFQSTSEYTNTVSGIPDALFNSVLSTKFTTENSATKIGDIRSHYNNKGLSFCWWVSPNCFPNTLGDELVEQNFQLFGAVEGMTIEIPSAVKYIFPEGIRHETAKSSNDFNDWIKPLAISFHMSESGANSYKNIFEDLSKVSDDMQHYVAYSGDTPVSSCTLFLDKESKSAGIYNCATMPDARKKGIISALTQFALLAAKQKGYKTAILQASPMSKGLFEKIGFESYTPYKVYLG